MYNYIIFDIDGTLIDTEPAIVSSYQRLIFEEFGRNCAPEELARGYGIPTSECIAMLGFKNVEESVKKYHTYLFESYDNVKVFNGIIKVLDYLDNKNIITGIVTARSRREVEGDPCLQSLITHFKHIVCADDTKKPKPDPEPILKLMKMSNAEITKTIYIGDTYFDYMCARNSGVCFGLAMWGAKTTDGINADYNFMDPEEILRIL